LGPCRGYITEPNSNATCIYLTIIAVVVTRIMANIPTPGFQKLWSDQIESLRLESGSIIRQEPGAEFVIKCLRGVLNAIARLERGTPAAVRESPKWTLIVGNTAGTTSNLQQLLKGKQLYSALHGIYIQVLHDLKAVVKESSSQGETTSTTITAPPSIEEFPEQERRKRKCTDDADKRIKKLATSTTGVNNPQLRPKDEPPTRNFAPLGPNERQAEHGDDADDSIKCQQQQSQSTQAGRPPPILPTTQVNLIHLQRQLKGLLK
jgi:hypothetical protein